MEAYGIEPISLVVVNLYPFTSQPGHRADRHRRAGDGAGVREEPRPRGGRRRPSRLRAGAGGDRASTARSRSPTRRRLARDAFAHTAAYDAAIVSWFDASETEPEAAAAHDPPRPRAGGASCATARTRTSRERATGSPAPTVGGTRWCSTAARTLSYLNLYDTEAAWRLVNDFEAPACVIVKHANPCGVALADDVAEAYVRANACDPVSAFGGIVAVNRHGHAGDGGVTRRCVHRGRRRARLRRRRARPRCSPRRTCA